MNNYVVINIKIRRETHLRAFGHSLLTMMRDFEPSLTPDFLDSGEDGRNTTPFGDLESALERWGLPKYLDMRGGEPWCYHGARWKRAREPRYKCYFFHGMLDRYYKLTPSSLTLTAKWNAEVDWKELFGRLCSLSDAQAGLIHHFTPQELPTARLGFADGSIFPISHSRLCDLSFTDISWAMTFGAEFLDRVDIAAIAAAGFPTKPAGTGYIVQVTDSLLDVSKRFGHFCERREALRALLPDSIFPDKAEQEEMRLLAEEYRQAQESLSFLLD